MAWQIIKNPDTNNYQIFSTIVDNFILDNEVTKEGLTQFWKEEYGRSGMYDLDRKLEIIDKGGNAYYQFTMTWDQALKRIKEIHGDSRG